MAIPSFVPHGSEDALKGQLFLPLAIHTPPPSNDDMSAFGSSTVWLALSCHSGWRLTSLPSMMLKPRYLIFFV